MRLIAEKAGRFLEIKFYRVIAGGITGIAVSGFILVACAVIRYSLESGLVYIHKPKTILISLIIGAAYYWLVANTIDLYYEEKEPG